ncbi:ATP-binding protein [Alteromonas ponticola]|uniref:histidine kinase n=1 Tax=Alteromonas aquimaris TaxID=2998417 RepID=A0ABT3P8W0_9ALTE|nr:ATP-binding protein [Alteromonas aquimaris]MCW8109159.1 ATP-binding protein [Alteromonas aquimaris]
MTELPDLSSCFENAACGLVVTAEDGTILRVNATFANWLGYGSAELIQHKKIQDLFTIGGRFFHHTHWAPLLHMQGSVAEVQIDLKAHDNRIVPMLVNALRKTHQGQTFDRLAFFVVNDRKKFEQELVSARLKIEASLSSLRKTQDELKRNQDVLSLAMHSAKMASWTLDINAAKVEWNSELQSLLGFDEESCWLTKEDFYRLIHPDDRLLFDEQLNQAIEDGENYTLECRLKNSINLWVDMEISGHVMVSAQGETQSVYGICMDVSERKARLRELSELNKKLSSSDRRKSEFLATLSHELRNPLAPIRNVLEIMRVKEDDGEVLKRSRQVIERHVTHMTRLIEDLMDISRVSHNRIKLRKQTIDILPSIQCAVEETTPLISASGHTLSVNKPEESIYINADATRIVQIFSNLLNNAAKYTPAGGAIEIIITHQEGQAVIVIKDSGIGIPANELANIFTMFSQLSPALERAQGGLGIGLALVNHLVKLHGGEIEVTSEGHNKGSQFIVKLPTVQNIADETVVSSMATQPQTTKDPKHRILVIDDNEDTAESLAELLEYNGHITCTAFDGNSGVKLANEFFPDIILSDIGLPDISGYEVAKRVREGLADANIYLVAITGWGQKKDKLMAKESGFNHHITKPVDFTELKRILAEVPKD